jgi:hypothetical protein
VMPADEQATIAMSPVLSEPSRYLVAIRLKCTSKGAAAAMYSSSKLDSLADLCSVSR